MFSLGLCEPCFHLGDCSLALLALLGPAAFFLPALAFTLALLFLERECRLAACLIVDLCGLVVFCCGRCLTGLLFTSSAGRSEGSWACCLNGPFDPTGRQRMTPGFDIAAAMTFGSLLSFATP
jgi:hypothetical protein